MLEFKSDSLLLSSNAVVEGAIHWRSPSNIAIIKYWGKYGVQLPRNASLSFTLSNAYTQTQVSYRTNTKQTDKVSVVFKFEGKSNIAFGTKVEQFLNNILDIFPFLTQLSLNIESSNSFPHSAGIASSASSMSALALCLCSLENKLFGTLDQDDDFFRKASYVARLGSGSASRSVFPYVASWGVHEKLVGSNNEFATRFPALHPIFSTFRDSILIVSKKEKSVSSRAGHALMEGNSYASARYKEANDRVLLLKNAFISGDLDVFGNIAEAEALTLHALMMASSPPYILMEPNSLAIIKRVQQYRLSTKVPIYFSLDAGPNIHLLYPKESENTVKLFIEEELKQYCDNGMIIHDEVGEGPNLV